MDTKVLNEIIEKYQGGNEMLSDEDADYLYINDLYDELENCIVFCNACHWWNEAHEMNEGHGDGDICNDCKEQDD